MNLMLDAGLGLRPPEGEESVDWPDGNHDQRPNVSSADTWIIDAGGSLVEAALNGAPSTTSTPSATFHQLSALAAFRRNFSHQINTIQNEHERLLGFVRMRMPCTHGYERVNLLLGVLRKWPASLSFENSCVLTSVAIFEDQDQINPLPAVVDLAGRALDAQVIALYAWLAAGRDDEYRDHNVCLCIAASLPEVYVVAPPEFPLWSASEPVTVEVLGAAITQWLAAGQHLAS